MVMTKLIGNDDRSMTEIELLVFQAGGELRIVQNNLDADGSVTLIVYNPKTDQEISVRLSSSDVLAGYPRYRITEQLAANTEAHAKKTVSVKIEVLQKMADDLDSLSKQIHTILERKKA